MNNAFGFEVPNLDDVEASWEEYQETVDMLDTLVSYMKNKQRAVKCRREGYITNAIHYEKICEREYMKLPVWARW